MRPELIAGITVILLGALAGAGELTSRYRDAPGTAMWSVPGMSYLVLNAGVSLLAFVCLRAFKNPINVGGNLSSFDNYFLQITAASFGAMGLLRTSFFNVRIDDRDVGLGPGLVLQVILDATDREVDRGRAQQRAEFVQQSMQQVSFNKARIALPAYCIALMQNLSISDQQKLSNEVKNLSGLGVDDDTTALILGLILMTYVGSDVLARAVDALGTRIRGLPPPGIENVAPASVSGIAPAAITITGGAFSPGAVVWINGTLCPNAAVTSPSTITCATPSGPHNAGAACLVIANPDGQTAICSDKFSFT
jgi:hypothetical protein